MEKVVVGSQSIFPPPYPYPNSRPVGYYFLQVVLFLAVVGIVYYWVHLRVQLNDNKVSKLQEIEDAETQ